MQLSSFNKAAGIIFISNYAKYNILDKLKRVMKTRLAEDYESNIDKKSKEIDSKIQLLNCNQ